MTLLSTDLDVGTDIDAVGNRNRIVAEVAVTRPEGSLTAFTIRSR
jgi:hypothetical protein